jgi:hypothetical protein
MPPPATTTSPPDAPFRHPGTGASVAGAGIANFGTLTVRDSTVLGNSAPLGGDLYNLGALYLYDSTVGVIAP